MTPLLLSLDQDYDLVSRRGGRGGGGDQSGTADEEL